MGIMGADIMADTGTMVGMDIMGMAGVAVGLTGVDIAETT
jgi:hypothetical protein